MATERSAADDADGDPRAREQRLWQEFVERRDLDARNRLIEHYLPLCRTLAASLYARRGGVAVEFMDYLQLATVGLIEAIDRFDPGRGIAFEAFAVHRIRGSVLNSLEALSETYEQSSLRKRLRQERLESLQRGWAAGKVDLFGELADVAVGFALSYMLDGSGMLWADDAQNSYRQDFYHGTEVRQLRELLGKLVDALPDQERRVIRYHYYQGLEFREIAELLGLTKGRISQIHRQGLQLIKEARAAAGNFNISL